MTRRVYSSDESLNRLARILKNDIPTSDIPGSLIGEYDSWNQALSDIAELFAASLPGEALTFPDAAYGDITSDGDITASGTVTAEDIVVPGTLSFGAVGISGDATVSGTVTAEDIVVRDDLVVEDDIGGGGDITVSGTVTGEDGLFQDDLTVRDDIGGGGNLSISGTATVEDLAVRDDIFVKDDIVGGGDVTITGTMTSRNIALGGYLTAALLGNGDIAMGILPTVTRPSGTLTNLGGVLFAEDGNLMWLGSSGTVSTVAGS